MNNAYVNMNHNINNNHLKLSTYILKPTSKPHGELFKTYTSTK